MLYLIDKARYAAVAAGIPAQMLPPNEMVRQQAGVPFRSPAAVIIGLIERQLGLEAAPDEWPHKHRLQLGARLQIVEKALGIGDGLHLTGAPGSNVVAMTRAEHAERHASGSSHRRAAATMERDRERDAFRAEIKRLRTVMLGLSSVTVPARFLGKVLKLAEKQLDETCDGA